MLGMEIWGGGGVGNKGGNGAHREIAIMKRV